MLGPRTLSGKEYDVKDDHRNSETEPWPGTFRGRLRTLAQNWLAPEAVGYVPEENRISIL